MEAHDLVLSLIRGRYPGTAATTALVLLFLLAVPPCSHGDSRTNVFAGALPAQAGAVLAVHHEGTGNLHDELRLVVPEKGHTYLSLISFVKDSPVGFVAGVNEKGLAAASKVGNPAEGRRHRAATVDPLPARVLGDFGSVDEVMRNQEVFKESGGDLYIVADKSRAVAVERGSDGRWLVTAAGSGFLVLTDELRVVGSVPAPAPGPDRQASFPAWHCPPLCAGPERLRTNPEELLDGSPWKQGGDSSGISTLSRWLVVLPTEGPPELLLRSLNPDDPDNPSKMDLLLDREFWTAGIE